MQKFILVILILYSNDINGQLGTHPKKTFSVYHQFCFEHFSFYKNNTYVYKCGCEGRQKINIGSYNLKTKKLVPMDSSQVKIILHFRILPSKSNNSNLVIKIKG